MDALSVARLVRDAETGSWIRSGRSPLAFADVTDYNEERARPSAVDWVHRHVENERPDLLEEDA